MVQKQRHQHEVVEAKTRIGGYHNCADSRNCNPQAHGGQAQAQCCSCGAVRIVNINQDQVETGPWFEL